MRPVKISPSILAADFARLKDEIQRVESSADMLHLDVMDGRFCPNLTIGPAVVERVRKVTRLFLDCHIMVMEPERFAPVFADAGADSVTFQAEAVALDGARELRGHGWAILPGRKDVYDRRRLEAAMEGVRSRGKRLGVAINPDTGAGALDFLDRVDMVLAMTVWPGYGGQKLIESVVPKVGQLRRRSGTVDIEVDGGINPSTVGALAKAGANVFVSGSAVFGAADAAGMVRRIKAEAEKARGLRED